MEARICLWGFLMQYGYSGKKTKKQSKCPSMENWLNWLLYIYRLEYWTVISNYTIEYLIIFLNVHCTL